MLFLPLLLAPVFALAQPFREDLPLKYLVREPADKDAPVLILLHGYGSNEQDLFGLCPELPKNYLIFCVRAPYPLPGGGYQWYQFAEASGVREGNKQQIENSRRLVTDFITKACAQYHADTRNVYVGGFSQGAIMSYEMGLTNPGKVRGIAVLSGRMLPAIQKDLKVTNALKNLRIFIAHGTSDNRIPFADGMAANDYLRQSGLKPAFHKYQGMGHTIGPEELHDLAAWLR